MSGKPASPLRAALIWGGVGLAIALPLIAAAYSPLLEWRQPVYIAAGFAGVLGFCLMLLQPLLAAGRLPGLTLFRSRTIHRIIGIALVLSVIAHVGGLWITSPPDVVDALLLVSPTPFSAWGVIAMWAIFAAAGLAALRKKLRVRPQTWRIGHTTLAAIAVAGTIVHALLIEGTMEVMSKTALCIIVAAVTLRMVADVKPWRLRSARHR